MQRVRQSGAERAQLFGFLTAEPNNVAAASKGVPVILTTADESETWMAAPPEKALRSLRIVARRADEAAELGVHS